MSLKKTSVLIGLLVLFLGGCSNESTAERIHGHLEEAVALEESFSEKQDQISELEKKEQELFNKMIELSTEEMDQVNELSNEAISSLDKKEKLIKSEKETIDSAKKEFDEVKPMIEKLEEEKAATNAEELAGIMDERYDSYVSLYDSYIKAIEEDRKLYKVMQDEKLKEEELKAQITTVNETYEEILAMNETFNEKTKEYNQLKKDFYDSVELQVEYQG